MPNINYWLGRKYDLLQQDANVNEARGMAEANLTNTRAGLLPGESAANVNLAKANTRLTNTRADLMPGESEAQVANLNANTRFIGIQADEFGPTARAQREYTASGTELNKANTDTIRRNIQDIFLNESDYPAAVRRYFQQQRPSQTLRIPAGQRRLPFTGY